MSGDRARILVLTYTPLAQEPRALKQVQFLKDDHDVVTAGFGSSPFPDVPHVEIPERPTLRFGAFGRLLGAGLLLLRLHRAFRWLNALNPLAARLLGDGDWDLVIAHDLKTLDAAFSLRPSRGVIVDLHEYAPRQEEHSFMWRLLIAPYSRWMCRTKVPRAAAVVTVSQGIADEYKREFGFDSTLVVNATPYHELTTSPTPKPIRLVHSGGVAPQRRLDIMIQGVRQSSADVTLDLFLVGGESELNAQLRELAGDDPRIRFRDPVPYGKLVETLNGYDVGLSIFPPTTFNLAWCLPNKFFDFVQARLGVIVGPSPEMTRIVEQHGFGMVLPDFESSSLSRALESLTAADVEAWKAASAGNALELSSESQAGVWDDLISDLLAHDRRAA